ncbi:MAG: flagellar type III secretion system pore protein FliP [Cyanobacteriota bacterium]
MDFQFQQTVQNLDPVLQLLIVMSLLALVPIVIITMTSFLRFVIVLSILRTALGTQQVPPAMVIVGLAFILTMYTMSPTFIDMYERGNKVHNEGASLVSALAEASVPLKDFMLRQSQESDVAFFYQLSKNQPPNDPSEINLIEAAPAFMIGELRTSFKIGFIIFIPFIVLDLVVANILLALGMFMLSPTIISLPFKLLIFIAVDGWGLIIHGLVKSFN